MKLAVPIAIGMVFQTLYYLVDLFFVGQLGDAAVAGLTSAGNVGFLIMAVTQILGVGTMALIAQASGRKDREDANLIFNQSLGQAALCALGTVVFGYLLAGPYMNTLGADAATIDAGMTYLYWFLPGLGLQFALISMGSALRGTGIVNPTIVVQVSTVVLNAILSPIMIAGWLTGRPMGLVGAGLSTTISVAVAVLMMLVYFVRLERYVVFNVSMLRPRWGAWKRILAVGLPPAGSLHCSSYTWPSSIGSSETSGPRPRPASVSDRGSCKRSSYPPWRSPSRPHPWPGKTSGPAASTESERRIERR